MQLSDIARERLARQGILAPRFESPEAVVGWLTAVQSQEYDAARWSLGQRTTGITDGDVEQALDEGRILRTHVLRPTWHFVLPEDIRWLVELSAPRIRRTMGYYARQFEVDESVCTRSGRLITAALTEAGALTRNEIARVLGEGGIAAGGQRLTLLLFHAELACLICSGPRKGKQHTYALFARRAPHAKSLPRDEALATLVRRFLESHGPATEKDLATWANLPLSDVRLGLRLLGEGIESLEVAGRVFRRTGKAPAPTPDAPHGHLLQGYDEYFCGAFDSKDVFGDEAEPAFPAMTHAVLLDGLLAGHWRRKVTAKAVTVDIQLNRPLAEDELQAVDDAIGRYGAFVGLPTSIGEVYGPGLEGSRA